MAAQIAPNVYWVGAVDWEVRRFHGHTYHTHCGTSYNAYLVVDPARIDYLVANHAELDHSGCTSGITDWPTN